MRGGDTMGQMTLSRAFVVHIAILPALAVLFISLHLVAFSAGRQRRPWNPKEARKDRLVLAKSDVQRSAGGLIDSSGADFVCPRLSERRFPGRPIRWTTPTVRTRVEFPLLYEALKAFSGSWEWLGTVVIPTLLILLLFGVPFIDRNEKEKSPQATDRDVVRLTFVAVILVMTFVGHNSNSGAADTTGAAHDPNTPTPASDCSRAD